MDYDFSRISSIVFDSRLAKPGCIYVAIKGERFNGEDFIDEAIEKGAQQIVLREGVQVREREGILYRFVQNPRAELAILASKFYPQHHPMKIAGVTGTSGKTSTVGFYRQICELSGLKAASIGTLGVLSNEVEIETLGSMTSPDPVKLHSILQALSAENIQNVAIEVSSHGLDQRRLDGVQFSSGAFTNFTQDHLDYHKTMESYFEAKFRLFKELLQPGSFAILNADIGQFAKLKALCTERSINIISYGKSSADISFSQNKGMINLHVFGKAFECEFAFDAEFQAYNAVCALALAVANGVELEAAVSSIPMLSPAVGRLEKVGRYNNADIFIDYAHKPDALEKVLIAARKFTKGKLYLVFGCGGDRDIIKRPIMGEIAARLADIVIITDDNPRTEDPSTIRAAIIASAPGAIEIGNRREAIQNAMSLVREGDTLIIAGKGHEDYQLVGEIKYRFSDAEEVKKVINTKDRGF